MIRMHVRVDDVADGHVAKLLELRCNLRGLFREHRVYKQNSVLADLNRDVSAWSKDRVDVPLDRQNSQRRSLCMQDRESCQSQE